MRDVPSLPGRIAGAPSAPPPPPKKGSAPAPPAAGDRFVRFMEKPGILNAFSFTMSAMAGAESANFLLGASLGFPAIALGALAGVGAWLLHKHGILRPAESAIKENFETAAKKMGVSGKLRAIGQRMAGELTDDVGDVTFAVETASAFLKSFAPIAETVNQFAFPVNAAAQLYGLPLDIKNFRDVVKNKDPKIDAKTRKRDLSVELAHVLGSFVSTLGSFVPPVDPASTGLNIGLQLIGFGANRGVDVWNVRRGWKQGYDGSLLTRLTRKMLRR